MTASTRSEKFHEESDESSSEIDETEKEHKDVYMSLFVSRQSIGCAIYDFECGRLLLLEDSILRQVPTSSLDKLNHSVDALDGESSQTQMPAHQIQSPDAITTSELYNDGTGLRGLILFFLQL